MQRVLARLRSRSVLAQTVELSGLAAIVYGVGLIYEPAAFVSGGLLAVLFATFTLK